MSSANKNTKYNVELSYGETILIKRNRGPIDTMGQQKKPEISAKCKTQPKKSQKNKKIEKNT